MLIRRQPPKPTMIDETLIEGYIVLYDIKYRIGKELEDMNKRNGCPIDK